MQIYKQEKRDGLSSKISDPNNSVATILVPVKEKQEKTVVVKPSYDQIVSLLAKKLSNSHSKSDAEIDTLTDLIGHDQPDLTLVVSILVSTGWNLNDDIFIPSEVWAARNSPNHKPMNHMHDGTIVVGHIIKSRVLDKDGDTLSSDNFEDMPDEFDIEVAGVLYKALPGREALVSDIISRANDGEMFVSMEAFFQDFDYGILDASNNLIKVVARTEETAFLTKHLRSFGGTGKFKDFRVGRVLKSIVFGGQGFVSDPANPDSIIKTIAFNKSNDIKLSEITEGGVVSVDKIQELEKERDDLKAKADSLTKENEDVKQELDSIKKQDFETKVGALNEKIEELNDSIAKMQEDVKTVKSEKIKLQKDLDDAVVRADKVEKEFDHLNKKIKAEERFVKLSEVKEIKDKEATLAELAEMTDDTFETVMKYAGSTKSDEVKDEKKEEVSTAKSKTNEVETETVQAALDEVVEEKEADLQVSSETNSDSKVTAGLAHLLCNQEQEEN